MNKLTWTIGAALIALGAYGCGGTCGTFCDYVVECLPDAVEDSSGYSSCKWDHGDDEALEACADACDRSMERLSDRERETAEACIDCLDEELGGECRGDDYVEAMQDCDNDCYDEDFNEFWAEFVDDMDDLECRG